MIKLQLDGMVVVGGGTVTIVSVGGGGVVVVSVGGGGVVVLVLLLRAVGDPSLTTKTGIFLRAATSAKMAPLAAGSTTCVLFSFRLADSSFWQAGTNKAQVRAANSTVFMLVRIGFSMDCYRIGFHNYGSAGIIHSQMRKTEYTLTFSFFRNQQGE
jgi:hypothetical protein